MKWLKVSLLFTVLFSLPVSAWQLIVEDQACQLSQTMTFNSDSNLYRDELFNVSFIIGEEKNIEFLISASDDRDKLSVPVMMFADDEFDTEGDDRHFHLKHSSSRDLFIQLSDFASVDANEVLLAVRLESHPEIVFSSVLDSDVMAMIKKNSVCFERLTGAISKI